MVNGAWESATKVLSGVIAALVGAWVAMLRTYASRKEVSRMIATESPYLQDRAKLVDHVERVDQNTRRIFERIDSLSTQQAETATKVDMILSELSRGK